jgi:membrane-associated protein
MLQTMFEAAQSLPWPLVCALIAVCAYLESALFVGLVVPGETALLAGGAAASATDGPLAVFVLAAGLGALAGDLTGFALGRRYGARLRASRLGCRLGEERWARADELLERHAGRAVLVGRFLPIAQAVVPVLAGSSTMSLRRRFLPWCAAGAFGWAGAYVTLGYAAGASYERLGDAFSAAALAVVAAGAVLHLALRARRRRRAATSRPVPAVRPMRVGDDRLPPFATHPLGTERAGTGHRSTAA